MQVVKELNRISKTFNNPSPVGEGKGRDEAKRKAGFRDSINDLLNNVAILFKE